MQPKSGASSKGAVAALIIFNSVPLFGAIFWKWDPSSILILFWLENVVIGFYTLLEITYAKGVPQNPIYSNIGGGVKEWRNTTAYFFFFLLHYGIFTFGHGVFVFSFFGTSSLDPENFVIPILGLFASHGVSYWSNFIQKRGYLTASPDTQMFAPYKRVIVMHLTVLFGGVFAKAGGLFAIPTLVLLVVLKIIVDVFSHPYEHNALPTGIIAFSSKGGIITKDWRG